ncbi:protein LATERAL ROOT PRIMORDIUM 1-like [Dorcoceras hygrometricum]|uniref:Protein LATERAL ROOT PRIMORDIUM 1-like n=1 Tax=Dorcoceras hygrometricum TaxID=472368 RepID=A0A2Z7BUV8_9LAMI|nr:protein LATERAL ROOT PRIMORDIUM 1-like [Dorcoceras hygrometricum]
MGNADLKDTKTGKENTRSSLSTKSYLKTANHATCYISSYEMHEAVKGIGQQGLLINWQYISIEPLYPHSVSIGEIIGMTNQSAGLNVALNQVINQSVNQAQDVSPATENSRPKKNRFLLASETTTGSSWATNSKAATTQMNQSFKNHEATRTRQPLRDPLPGRFKPPSWYQSKEQLKENPAPPISFKTTAEITGNTEEKFGCCSPKSGVGYCYSRSLTTEFNVSSQREQPTPTDVALQLHNIKRRRTNSSKQLRSAPTAEDKSLAQRPTAEQLTNSNDVVEGHVTIAVNS